MTAVDLNHTDFAAFARSRNGRFTLALLCSLLLHALVLWLNPSEQHEWQPRESTPPPRARIDATLNKPRPKTQAPQPTPHTKTRAEPRPRVLAMPSDHPSKNRIPDIPEKNWSRAERDEMDQFLNGLAEEARPASGAELAQRALAMARTLKAPPENDEAAKIMRRLAEAQVEPFSLEMYFNALFNKMNRSAAMIGNSKRTMGVKVAAVRIELNRDGSVKNFEILRAADQQAEIDFIRAVVDMAAPFPVFPPDIGRATDKLILQICIRPDLWGSGGPAFTRMGSGESCR